MIGVTEPDSYLWPYDFLPEEIDMPHDKNGAPLKVGDKVMIPCTVKSVCEGEFCTLECLTDEVMPGNKEKSTVSAINAAQVVKCCDDAPAPSKKSDVQKAAEAGFNDKGG